MDINNVNPKCSEIWMCDLSIGLNSDYLGNVQGGCRPVFIISNDKNNKFSPNVTVMPLTSKMNKRNLPVHVELQDYRAYGLKRPSTIMAENMTTIPKDSLKYKMGQITDSQILEEICKAIEIQCPVIELARARS